MAAVGAALIGFAIIAPRVEGADHKDGARATAEVKADINDVYAFRSPENANNVVFAMTVNPLTPPSQNGSATLDPSVSYNLHIDQTGDLVPDITATFRFVGDTFTVSGLGATPVSGQVTPLSATTAIAPVVNTAGPIRIFVGLRDDPFIMDLVGIKAFLANPVTPVTGVRPAGQTPVDAFGGTNVSMILVELPVATVTGGTSSTAGTVRAWASTSRAGVQIDRMAIPGINVLVIPEAQKDAFNSATPATSIAQFGATFTAQITAVRASVVNALPAENGGPLGNLTPAQVTAALAADAVTIDFSKPLAFPNGRQLQDDVVNAALGVVLNRGGAAGISDAVDSLDRPVTATFPYAAAPQLVAAAPGVVPAPAKTGSAGLMGNSGAPAAALAMGILMVVLGASAMVRQRVNR